MKISRGKLVLQQLLSATKKEIKLVKKQGSETNFREESCVRLFRKGRITNCLHSFSFDKRASSLVLAGDERRQSEETARTDVWWHWHFTMFPPLARKGKGLKRLQILSSCKTRYRPWEHTTSDMELFVSAVLMKEGRLWQMKKQVINPTRRTSVCEISGFPDRCWQTETMWPGKDMKSIQTFLHASAICSGQPDRCF